jgi:hypothetical protein
MRVTHRWSSIAIIALAAACGDDGQGPEDTAALLQDTWVATRWTYISEADPADSVSFTSAGVTVTLTIGDPDYEVAISGMGMNESFSGTYSVNGSSFVISDDGSGSEASIPFSFSNGNKTLTMSDPNTNWDFDEDGVDDPATLHMVFARQEQE